MLNCKDMTKLISDSLEGKVSVRQRMELWLHGALVAWSSGCMVLWLHMMCGICWQFRSNILELRKRVRGSRDLLKQPDSIPLPSATKAWLEATVRRYDGS